MRRSPLVAFGAVLALVIPLLVVGAQPAFASHFIAVEPRVDVLYDRQGAIVDGYAVTYAVNVRLRIDHRWTSSGTFTPTLTAPDASNTSGIPRTTVVSNSGAGAGGLGLQIYDYDFSGVTPVGVFTLGGGSCCDKSFVNGTSSGSFSFEIGFYFNKDDRPASQGSPRFNSAIITNIAGGTTFSQDLGGQSVNPGGSVTLSLVEDSATNAGAPVTVAGLKPGGNFQGGTAIDWTSSPNLNYRGGDLLSLSGQTLTIPSAVSTAIAAFATKSLKVKLRLEESVGGVSRGFLTRTIGFDFAVSSNNAPSIALAQGGTNVAAGSTLTVAQGSSVTLTATASDADSTDVLTVAFTSLPSWATAGAQVGTNDAVRTLVISPTAANSVAGDRTLEITAVDDDAFALTTSFSFIVRITAVASTPAPPAEAPAPSPVADPGGGLPVTPPGASTGSVGGVPVVPTPARPTPGTASFQVGSVQTRIDVAVAGAGSVGGTGAAPVIRAVRDRVATIAGGGMRPGGIAEVWMPLPDGRSRQVALLPIGADGTFDGALPFTGELDGRGPLPIGERTIQLFGTGADGQLTVINVGVRIEQPGPLAPEARRESGAPPTLAPGQSLATNAGVATPVTVTPLPDARSTRIEGDGWLMDIDVPDGTVRDEAGAPLIEIVNGTDSVVRGTGFMPGTRAYVWLMSDPTFLGQVTVGANGTFSGDVPIDGAAAGQHTLQLSGVGTDGFVRAANLGVVLLGDGMPRPTRIDAGEGPSGIPGGTPFGVPVGALLALGGLALGVVAMRQRAARART